MEIQGKLSQPLICHAAQSEDLGDEHVCSGGEVEDCYHYLQQSGSHYSGYASSWKVQLPKT